MTPSLPVVLIIVQLNGCTIDATCLLQRRPAQDTAESEWYGFAAACKWVEWYIVNF